MKVILCLGTFILPGQYMVILLVWNSVKDQTNAIESPLSAQLSNDVVHSRAFMCIDSQLEHVKTKGEMNVLCT